MIKQDELLKEFDGDKAVVYTLMEGFVETIQSQFGVMEQALSTEDIEVLHREAHAIKGGSLNLKLDKMAASAFKLEMAAKKQESLGKLNKKYEKLKKVCAELILEWNTTRPSFV